MKPQRSTRDLPGVDARSRWTAAPLAAVCLVTFAAVVAILTLPLP